MRPEFTAGDPLLARSVQAATVTLLDINTVPGRGPHEPAHFLRAGGGYNEPWTRDAAINSWLAASWLTPHVAENTLRMVCEEGPDGPVVAQDDQWWDHVIWVVAAHRHALLTGDRQFLEWAEGVARRSLDIAHAGRYVEQYGLFRGGAVMADGISGYPADVVEPGNDSSFVIDHPRTHEVFCLSTNLIHAAAYEALGEMADALGRDGEQERARSCSLAEAVGRHFRDGDGYGYLLVPGRGGAPDRLDRSQDALGLAFVLLGGLVNGSEAQRLIDSVHREPYGVVALWPALQKFTMEHPGRHNVIVWPWITGVWTQAVGRAGDITAFGLELATFLKLIAATDFTYPEVQNPQTGVPDGGWQCDEHSTGEYLPGIGRSWESEPNQTWSATSLLGVVLESLLGLRPQANGMRVAPTLPVGVDGLRLSGIRYGSVALDVEARGQGSRLVELTVDDVALDVETALLPVTLRDEPPTKGQPRIVQVRATVAL